MLEHKLKRYVSLSVVMACLQFVLIICIPFVSVEGTTIQRVMTYIIAFLFWASIVFEVLLACWSDRERRKLERHLYRSKEIKQSLSGVFSFFKNKEAMVTDIVLFISVLSLGIIIWMHVKTSWIIISVVSILIFSFSLHSVLNGRNYRYLKELKNNVKEQTKDE